MRTLLSSRKRAFKLPTVHQCLKIESKDYGPPEIEVQIAGCVITKVLVDGGSSVNIMTEATATELGFHHFETTPKILRMADQTRVIPAGALRKVDTVIGGRNFKLDYIIIQPSTPSSFPILLGRPWLYMAKVKVNWHAKQFSFGSPRVILSWEDEPHQGETEEEEEYTSDSTLTSSDDEGTPWREKKAKFLLKEDHVRFLDIFEFESPSATDATAGGPEEEQGVHPEEGAVGLINPDPA